MPSFVSNIPLSHSANFHRLLPRGQKHTFRGYMKPTLYGAFDWRFVYHNTVDSTWDDGSVSFSDMPGGYFRILHAEVCACDENQQVLTCRNVTFSGAVCADVTPHAVISSDPVHLHVPHGGYVMFSWCLQAPEEDALLPGTPDSRALCYISETDEGALSPLTRFRLLDGETEECSVLPNLWQVERDVQYTAAFIGDSITQGCQTRLNHYEQWAARIIRGLPQEIAGLNIGLGYARAQDAAKNGAWLQKLKGIDLVHVCLGVNDIFQMTEQEDHADVLTRNLQNTIRLIKQNTPDTKVVLFTVPPFSMEGESERVRSTVNERIRTNKLGADTVFDMEILAIPGTKGQSRFGDHPDGVGGAVVAGEYLTHFLPEYKHMLFTKAE